MRTVSLSSRSEPSRKEQSLDDDYAISSTPVGSSPRNPKVLEFEMRPRTNDDRRGGSCENPR